MTNKEMREIKISIEEEKYILLEQKASSTGCSSLEEFISKTLDSQVKDIEQEKEEIAKKLEALGYM